MTANLFLLVWKWCQARLRFKIRVRSNWRSNQTENLKSRKPAQAMPKCLNDMLLSSQLRPTPLCCVLWCYDVFLVYSLLSDLQVTAQLLLKHISRVLRWTITKPGFLCWAAEDVRRLRGRETGRGHGQPRHYRAHQLTSTANPTPTAIPETRSGRPSTASGRTWESITTSRV